MFLCETGVTEITPNFASVASIFNVLNSGRWKNKTARTLFEKAHYCKNKKGT